MSGQVKSLRHRNFLLGDLNLDKFMEFIKSNLNLNTSYSFLIQLYNSENKMYKMAGSQIPFFIKKNIDGEFMKNLYSVFLDRINIVLNDYHYGEITIVQFRYYELEGIDDLQLKNLNQYVIPKELTVLSRTKNYFNNQYLPLTLDTKYYGDLLSEDEIELFLNKIMEHNLIIKNKKINYLEEINLISIKNQFYKYHTKNKDFIIVVTTESNLQWKKYIFDFKTGILVFKAIDKNLVDDVDSTDKEFFSREINSLKIFIKNQKVIQFQIENKLSLIEPNYLVKKRWGKNRNFGTFDVETFIDEDGISKIFALGFKTNFDESSNLFYITDNEDWMLKPEKMVLMCLNTMLDNKYNNYLFYCHNFGKFDFVFIFNIMLNYNKFIGHEYYVLKPLMKDDKLLRLDVKINKNYGKLNTRPLYITISFIDSYNLLPQSLDSLSKDFNVEIKKGIFPYKFVNKDNFGYIGKTPDMEFFSRVSEEDYKGLIQENWNLKKECLEYLNKDLSSLLLVLNEFNDFLYINYNSQLIDGLTITRLALNIFLNKYYKNTIALINKPFIFDFLKKGYYGGITEVYKPYGKDLLFIDVNSLYPYMALNTLAGNICTYVESLENSELDLDSLFGFFYVKVKVNKPNYLGLLPLHINNQLILPEGEFEGVWFSEELKFAKQNGYDIKVIKGYEFNKVDDVFKNYIEELHNIKQNSHNANRYIAKSLLNNLLGRFGLNTIKYITNIVDINTKNFLSCTRKVLNIINLPNNKYLMNYENSINRTICESFGMNYIKILEKENLLEEESKTSSFKDVSIVITAMITSYARIFMNKCKLEILNNGGQIYYSDTDSLVLDKTYLNPSWIGSNLGQFKLEYNIKEGFFVSNKTYCLILEDDSVIIKSKGINNTDLSKKDFENMLFYKNDIKTSKINTVTNYEKGFVLIEDKNVILKYDSYIKREKIFNEKGLWIDTKPLNYKNCI